MDRRVAGIVGIVFRRRVQQALGQLAEAIEGFRTAVRLAPDEAAWHSNLLYALNYHPGYDAEAIFAEHRNWAARHADPLTAAATPHAGEFMRLTGRDTAAYDREGQPCLRAGCRGTVRRIVQSGRSSFYCPACQRFIT